MVLSLTLLDTLKTIYPVNGDIWSKDNEALLLEIITLCICKIVKHGDEIGKNTHDQFMPPNKKLPAISVKDYLNRLYKYAPCSRECFIASLVYIDRLSIECGMLINSFNIHRILITCLLISTKYLDDIFYNNEFYSQVGGVSLKEMNSLELDFLKMLNFSAICPNSLFEEYQREMESSKERFLHNNHSTTNNNILNKITTLSMNISSPLVSSPSNLSPRRQQSPSSSSNFYQRRGSCDYAPTVRSHHQQSKDSSFHTNCAA
eukprot:gene3112-3891_t